MIKIKWPSSTRVLSSENCRLCLTEPAKPRRRAASTALNASVPKTVQSHISRSSGSVKLRPKLAKTMRRQAGTQEYFNSWLWKGGFDGIAMLFVKTLGHAHHLLARGG